MTHTPTDAAMRFVVKYSGALRLDPFACEILAKAIDTEFPASTEAIEAGAVQGLVDAAKWAKQELYDAAHSNGNPDAGDNMQSDAVAYRDLRDALSQLAEASNG